MKQRIWGSSNYTGFEMGYKGIEVRTCNFGWMGTAKLFFIFAASYLAIDYAASQFVGEVTLFVIGVIYFACTMYFLKKEGNEWHAAEHKIINLLQNIRSENELTMENLINSSSKTNECGAKNKHLRDPSRKKLLEAIKIGREFLEKRNDPDHPAFFLSGFWVDII